VKTLGRATAALLLPASAALLGTAGVHVLEAPADYANHVAIPADGSAALYHFPLTVDVYRGAADAELADLRIFNGAGELLPFAFYPRPGRQSEAAAAVALQVFAIPAPAAATGAAGGGIHVETNSAGGVVRVDLAGGALGAPAEPGAYLLDASTIKSPIRALTLDVKAGGDYSGKARLEASSDLASWHVVAAETPILEITQGTVRLERRRVEFPAQMAAYFRLAWTGMPAGTQLRGVQAQPGDRYSEPEREWAQVPATPGSDKPGDYGFDSGAHFPADRIRVELPQGNTVASMEIFSRASAELPWRQRAHETVYRLNRAEGEVVSPPLTLGTGTDRYWLLRVDPRGGGLGVGVPRIFLGWVPQEIAFAARGAPPYELAFGNRRVTAADIGIAALIPGYRDERADKSLDRVTDLTGASGGDGAATLQPVRVVLAGATQPIALPPDPGMAESLGIKRLALWSVLSAGVGLLAWMAWRLLRQMNAADPGPGS
jgi:hypothetical protein